MILSKVVLQWMSLAFGELETLKKGSSSFLKLLPAFFQLLLTVAELHPSLHADAFYLAALVLNTPSDDLIPESMGGEVSATGGVKLSQENMTSAGGGYNGIMAHEDAARVIVQLMGWGYALVPMAYLTKKVKSFDAALVRHLVSILTTSIVGVSGNEPVAAGDIKLSKPFASALSSFFAVDRVEKALCSAYLEADIARAAVILQERAQTVSAREGEDEGDIEGGEGAMDVEELF